jgi:hypothetical protein
MRAAVNRQTARDLTENAARQKQVEREAAKAEAALARVERDYLDGKLSIEKWERLQPRLLSERDGARAEAEQHERQREAIEAQAAAVDAEAAVLEELAARRRAVAGAIREGREGDLDELRAVLRRLFVGFELASPAVRFGSGVLRGPGWVGSDDGKCNSASTIATTYFRSYGPRPSIWRPPTPRASRPCGACR